MGNGSPHRSPVYTLADHTKIPTQHMAPTQPNSSPATTYLPHQRLGNSHRSPRRQAIPLPDHPGSNGPGSTATEVIARRHINLATLGGTWTPVRTLAIHAPIPYPSPRRSMATHHTSPTRTTHGFSRPLHPTSSHQHHRSIQKHHAGKLLARAHGDLDAISSFDLRTECQHTPRGPVHQPTEDDGHLEQLRRTMGSATTGTTTSLHATDGLDPPSPLGPTTPPKQPTTRSSGSNLTLGNTTTSPHPQHQRSQSQHRHRTPITCQ